MMWWITLAGLALAQDDATRTERLLGTPPEAASTVAPATTAEGTPEAVPLVSADPAAAATTGPIEAPAPVRAAPAPVQAPLPAPATTSVASSLDTGWMWSLGGPLALLVLAGAGAWYMRKKGVNVRGLLKGGFTSVPVDGPLIEVGSRTPLAGQEVLAVVQVSGAGRARQLLVATGPQGSSLIADLSPEAPPAVAPPAPAVSTEAIEAAVQRALRTAQGTQAPAPAPVPVMAAPAVAPGATGHAPQAAPRAVEAPIQEAPRAVEAPIHEASRAEAPRPVEVEPEPPAPEARRPAPPAQGDQDEEAFARTLQDHLDRASARQAPPDDADERADWRTAAFLDRAGPDRTLPEEDIGPAVRVRRSARARDLTTRQTRDEAPQERPRAGRSRDVRKGHLEQLVRKGPRPQRRRVRGNGVRNYDPAARRERTEAARALLEQVMARREREGR